MRIAIHASQVLLGSVAGLLGIAPAAADTTRSSAADTQLHDQVINNALGMTSKVRQAVENFRLHHNAFPSDSAEIGLNPTSAGQSRCSLLSATRRRTEANRT